MIQGVFEFLYKGPLPCETCCTLILHGLAECHLEHAVPRSILLVLPVSTVRPCTQMTSFASAAAAIQMPHANGTPALVIGTGQRNSAEGSGRMEPRQGVGRLFAHEVAA